MPAAPSTVLQKGRDVLDPWWRPSTLEKAFHFVGELSPRPIPRVEPPGPGRLTILEDLRRRAAAMGRLVTDAPAHASSYGAPPDHPPVVPSSKPSAKTTLSSPR